MRLDSVGNGKSQNHLSGASRVKAGLHEVEGKVRRQVRAMAQHISATLHHDETDKVPKPKGRQGIVSINGQDVETMHCTGRKRA